jgi:hypothetical protein
MMAPADSESSAKECADDPGWLRRVWRPQSAFTMGDLVNVARADEPHARLERIYEWYFSRTMNAIRVASVAAGGAAAAIYGLAVKRPPCTACEGLLSSGLTAAAIVCVIAGIAQRRELAQLHTELARAHGLLADLSAVSKERLAHIAKASVPSEKSLTDRGLAAVALVSVAAIGFAVGWGQKPPNALEALAVLVALLGSLHVLAEVGRHRPARREESVNDAPATDAKRASAARDASEDHEPEPTDASEDDEPELIKPEPTKPGLTALVDVRLDDFVMLPSVRNDVLDAIKYEVKTYERRATV